MSVAGTPSDARKTTATLGCDTGSSALRGVDAVIAELLIQADTHHTNLATGQLPLTACAGRVLAEAISAPHDVPAWANSAMDGYAVAAADLLSAAQQSSVSGTETSAARIHLPLDGRQAAGDSLCPPLRAGHARRIFTGAPLPAGADTVIAQEQVMREGESVYLPRTARGANVRAQAEELSRGQCVLTPGTRLRAPEIALIASLGYARVRVFAPLRIGLLSTGNELCTPGAPLAAGHIHDANGPGLATLLRGWGFEVIAQGIVADQPAALTDALLSLSAQCDVLISSGGVSVGEEDHLKAVVSTLGELSLWRVAIQPGKPLAVGRVGSCPWLGLPGNPTSAFITAMIIAKPYLLRLQGQARVQASRYALPAAFSWPTAKPRRQYLRASLNDSGHVTLHAQQGSAMLSPACASDGLAMIDAGCTVALGDAVAFLPYAGLLS